MATIIRISRAEWHTYDTLFRKHAALRREWRWRAINPTIYARCFTSATRNPAKCDLCLAITHDTRDCSQQDPSEDMESRLRSMERSIKGLWPAQPHPAIQFSGEVCRKWSKGSVTTLIVITRMFAVNVEGSTQQCFARDMDDRPLKAGLPFGLPGRPPKTTETPSKELRDTC